MISGFGLRTLSAIVLVAVAAIGAALLGGGVQASLVAFVGGVAAVLVAAGTGEAAPPRARETSTSASDEEALVTTEEILEAIVEPLMIVVENRVTSANRAARALLGNHIVGEDVRVAIRHPAAAERLGNPRATTASGPINLVGLGTKDQRWEMRIGAASGGHRIVHLIDQTGNYATERIRVDFVANASHELRTPLSSILGFIETLSDEKAGDDADLRNRFLKVMFDEARRMQRLVDDLMSLSRIEAEKYRVPETEIDLAELIGEVQAELWEAPGARGRDIVADTSDNVPEVAGDRVQLSQMLHNLVGNSMKYGRPGTPVTIRLWQDRGTMVRLSVIDEGEGIPTEHIPRLTERFYRVDSGRSRALGGTGLGLAIVKHIVERHRGRMDIVSSVGKGTTVTILLPPAPGAVSSKSNLTVTEATLNG